MTIAMRRQHNATETMSHYWEDAWSSGKCYNTIAINRIASKADINNKAVLEIGCGNMELSLRTHSALQYIGLDIAFAPLADAKQWLSHISATKADASALPFKSKKFDSVIAIYVFPLLGERIYEVTLEASRVLKPGGALIFNCIHSDWLRHTGLKESGTKYGTLFTGDDFDRIGLDCDSTMALLRDTGLEPESVKTLDVESVLIFFGQSVSCNGEENRINHTILARAKRVR